MPPKPLITQEQADALEQGADALDPLSHKQRAFVTRYLEHHDPGRAALEAGYSARTNRAIASHLFRIPAVAAEIERGEALLLEHARRIAGVSLQRTLTEASRLAFFDIRRLFNDDGSLKAPKDLDEDTASAIASFEVNERHIPGKDEGENGVERTYKVKLADRKGAVEMLMKHLGGFKADNEQGGKAAVGALADLMREIRGSSIPIAREATPDA